MADGVATARAPVKRRELAPAGVPMTTGATDALYTEAAGLLAKGGEKGAPIEGAFVPDDEDVVLLEARGYFKLHPDLARLLAVPGLPYGMVIEACGKKDSGKTTFAVECLVAAQQQGGLALLLDTEHKFNMKRARDMGLDPRRLVIIQADTLEGAFAKFKQVIDALRQSERFKHMPFLCVWDSLGQTPSEAEEKAPDLETFAMVAAKVIKGGFRRLVKWLREADTTFLVINHVYANMKPFGKKTTSYGGSGLEYAAVLILEFVNLGHLRPKGVSREADFAGSKVQIECTKNHLGQPFRKLETAIDWRGFAFDRDVEYAPEPPAPAAPVTP